MCIPIRKLLNKYMFTDGSIVPPPPNTAVTTQRSLAQPAERTSHPQVLCSDPSRTIRPSDSSVRPTLSVSLPVPPPSSPILPPRTHKISRVPNRALFSSSPQPPVETYTMTTDPNSSQLQHSLCVNMNQLQQSPRSPSRPSDASEQRAKQSVKSPSPGKQKKRGGLSLGKGGEVRESMAVDSMTVTGEKREVMVEENRERKMVNTKKAEGKKLRKAEKQIMETLIKAREPPSKDLRKTPPPTTIHRAPRLSKEALAFSRVFESMTLSTLRAVERIHEVEKARGDWDRKATHVTRMKIEREKRRLKIQDIHQRTKETIEAWKVMEENRISRLQDQNAQQISQHLLEKSIQRSTVTESRNRDAADRWLAAEFAQQALSISQEVSKDDRKISAESKREEIKRQVEQLTEAARQRKDEARTEKEIRDTQLLWEGVLAKKELNGKMMQVCVLLNCWTYTL